ncbi:hypothetical protein [Mycolicibacterium thermoresistibile]|nr:hypothetical protein [Mycolicibacterium thermoresistibile]
MALLAVIAVTAVVSVSIASGGDDSPAALPGGGDSEYASANDTGPVNIITEDPTCAAWIPINNKLARIQQNGWHDRDRSIPAETWTSRQRAQYEEVAEAMRDAADQVSKLMKVTPNRAMRLLYEQFIAYARAYSNAVPDYEPADNFLVGVVGAVSSALVRVCLSIEYGAAPARAPFVAALSPSLLTDKVAAAAPPQPFLGNGDPTCSDWYALLAQFREDTVAWQNLDAEIPANEWSQEQRKTIDDIGPVMKEFANDIEELGRRSSNATLQDLALLAAQYRRAYVESLPTYTSVDSYLSGASAGITSAIIDGCRAAEA